MKTQIFTAVTVSILIGACSFLGDDEVDTLFIVQSAPQPVVLQALYQGKVVRSGECIRLGDQPEGHSVVWPHGFRLSGPKGDVVFDGKGRTIGLIGGTFHLGGGEVATLWEEGPVNEATRQEALTRCPGRYWLVGETLFD